MTFSFPCFILQQISQLSYKPLENEFILERMTVYEVLQRCEYCVHPKWSSIYKMINCERSNLMRS